MGKVALFFLSLSLYTGLVHYLISSRHVAKESEPTLMILGILVTGYLLLKVLQSKLVRVLEAHVDHDRILTLRYFLDVGYFLVWGFVLVAFLGAGFKNLVLGGAVLSAIAGIVAQGSLTNLFAGVVLAITHPFKVGEKISFLAWQFPRLPPTFSHDILSPEHTGTVLDIGKIYTRILGVDGRELYVPNNILLQAMILRENPDNVKPVLFVMELPKETNLSAFRERILSRAATESRLEGPVEIYVRAWNPSTVTVEIHASWHGANPLDFNRLAVASLEIS